MKTHSRSLVEAIKTEVAGFDLGWTPMFGAEVGVWEGGNSWELLSAFPNLHLLMVDRWEVLNQREAEVNRRLGKRDQDDFTHAMIKAKTQTEFASERRTIVSSDSVAAAHWIKDGSLHFAFLDGNHAPEQVVTDIDAWAPKIMPGGILSGHDYGGKGDRSGRYGVKKAVDAYAEERYYKVQILPGNVWYIVIPGSF